MVVMVSVAGLAKQVHQGANDVEARPAHVKPVEPWYLMVHKKMQDQVSRSAHDQARHGNELVAVEGTRAVKFGEIHARRELGHKDKSGSRMRAAN